MVKRILTDDIIPGLKAKTQTVNSGWQRMTLLNGWQEATVTQYRKLTFPGGGAIVYLRGRVTPPASKATQVASLPDGFRPTVGSSFLVPINGIISGGFGEARLSIDSSGAINFSDIGSATTLPVWMALDCSFLLG